MSSRGSAGFAVLILLLTEGEFLSSIFGCGKTRHAKLVDRLHRILISLNINIIKDYKLILCACELLGDLFSSLVFTEP